MSIFKYKLVEQQEEDNNTTKKSDYDLILTPIINTVGDAISALEKLENYGSYISNARNTKADVEKAVIAHFGPSQPHSKKKAEKDRGEPFPIKTKATINDFIKTLSLKPTLLKWKVVGDTLVFPASSNPSKKITEKIINTVMNNAGLDFDLENKESTNKLAEQNDNFSPSDKLYYDIIEKIRIATRQMNDDEAYKFHEKLKKWTNSLI